jgi:hypothetical protein
MRKETHTPSAPQGSPARMAATVAIELTDRRVTRSALRPTAFGQPRSPGLGRYRQRSQGQHWHHPLPSGAEENKNKILGRARHPDACREHHRSIQCHARRVRIGQASGLPTVGRQRLGPTPG